MTWVEKGLLAWVGVLSLAAVIVNVYDKWAAARSRRRIPERTLLWLAALGAAPATYITMRLIRHKTRKAKFMWGIPAIMAVQIALVVAVYRWI